VIEEGRLVDQAIRRDPLPEGPIEQLAVVERRRIDRRLDVLDRLSSGALWPSSLSWVSMGLAE